MSLMRRPVASESRVVTRVLVLRRKSHSRESARTFHQESTTTSTPTTPPSAPVTTPPPMTAEPPPPSLDDDPMRAVACARPPLFELDDADGWAAALEHDGFAVIANIVAPALRAELVEQFWAEFVAACRELPEASPLARVARGDCLLYTSPSPRDS